MKDLPTVSVVIPMRNEAGWIEQCLESVFAQDYPEDHLEVLVVDGMSDDGCYEAVSGIAGRETRLRVLRNAARIVPSSLNLGIEAARGQVIARVDAHTRLASDYLSAGVEALERTGAENVGGPMVAIGGGSVGDAIARVMRSRFGIGAYFHFATEERDVDTVYMGMWPRSLFERIGLFDEDLVRNQDDELNYRIRKRGGRIVVIPKMRSWYQNRQSWLRLLRQFYEYGLWKVRVFQKHPQQMRIRHFLPPLFDLALLCGIALAPMWRPAAVLSAAAALLYFVVISLVCLVEGEGLRARARLLLAFLLVHHAWAAGFLVGSVRFAGRWLGREPEVRRLTADVARAAEQR